jgi:hypothetical protein
VTASVSDAAGAIGAAIAANVVSPDGTNIRYLPYLGDQVNPPVVLVAIEKAEYHLSADLGAATLTFTAALILPRASDREALAAMEGYMSSTGTASVRAAVESDDTLGGKVQNAVVLEAGPPKGLTVAPGAVYLELDFKIEVIV